MSFQLPSGPVPSSLIPYAGRVDTQRLLSVVAIPFAAAIAGCVTMLCFLLT